MSEIDRGITQAIALIKSAQETIAKLDAADAREALVSAREQLADVRDAGVALMADKHVLESRITELEAALRLQPTLTRHQGVYWRDGDQEPWCPSCWERDQRALHLNPTDILAGRLAVCPRCDYSVNLDNVTAPKASRG